MDTVETPRQRATLTISIRVWIITDEFGNAAASEETVRCHVDNANRIWDRANIQFEVESIETWQSSKYYKINSGEEFSQLEDERWHRRNPWIDVYYAKEVKSPGTYGTCSFPHPREAHAIAIDDTATNSTLAHELGHYLNLVHTFEDDLSDTQSTGDGDPRNIMSYNRTTNISNIHLTVSQIERARESAFSDRANMIAPPLWAVLG